MKRKIICAFLCAVILFSTFSLCSFAAEPDVPKTLKDEIQSNCTDIDINDYTVDRGAALIGFTILWKSDWPVFVFYFSLPEYKGILSGSVCFGGVDRNIYLVAREDNFYKYEFSLPQNYISVNERKDFLISNVKLDCGYSFEIECNISASYDSENILTLNYNLAEVVALEVHSTNYVTNSTPERYDYDNIVSLYFSVPDKYQDWYDFLYSVTVQMLKRRTKPIFVSGYDFGDDIVSGTPEYVDSINQLLTNMFITSENGSCGYAESTPSLIYQTDIITDHFWKIPDGYIYSWRALRAEGAAEHFEKIDDFVLAFCDSDAKTFYDIDISGDILREYVKKYSSEYDLFIDKAYNKYVTKTIDETWDSFDYSYSADFFDYWRDFGFFDAIKYLFLKDNETELYKFFEELGIAPDGYNFKDEPFLVKVDDTVKADLASLAEEAFCDKYAIGYDDYEHFKKYVAENDNVLIYRIDIDSYISMPVHLYESDVLGFPRWVSDSKASGIIQTCVYDDVQVIDITMKRDGEYHSLKTSSNIVTIYPDLEGIVPESGMPSDGDFLEGLGDFIKSKTIGNSTLKAILVAIFIVAAVVLLVVLFFKALPAITNLIRFSREIKRKRKKNKH